MDSIVRIMKTIALLAANPQGISGGELARVCGIPWPTLKKDLEYISQSYPVYTDRDDSGSDEDIFQPDVVWYPVEPFEQYLPVTLGVQEAFVLLRALELLGESPERSRLREKLIGRLGLEPSNEYRLIKGSMVPVRPIDSEVFPILDLAVNECRQVSFSFGERKAVVDPLGLVFYSRLRHWYLLAREGETVKTFNLQKAANMRLTSNRFSRPDFEIKDWMSLHWGMEYGEPMRVKVRFANRSHTFDKVRKDTAHRGSKLTVSDDGNTMLMEDTVIGFNEFVTWVLGFGSAAEVLEPPELRRAVRDRVTEVLEVYGLERSTTER